MEQQILLNETNYIDIPYIKSNFTNLNKQEQAEFMKRKLSIILKQCEEITRKLSDESIYLEKPKH